jgi:hypothetical protein
MALAAVLAAAALGFTATSAMAAAKASGTATGTPAAKAGSAAPAAPVVPPAPSTTGFAFVDTAGQHLDIYLDGKPVARWVYVHDAAKRDETYKPFLAIYDAEGKNFITKGPGGFFTHHRGIFFGWQEIGYNGKKVNLWEMPDGDQVQQKFLAQKADATQATFTALIHWILKDGTTIIEEERTMTLHADPAVKGSLLVDFSTKVKAVKGDLALVGNAEHGGVQYRAADDVDRAGTKYCFPPDAVKPADAAEWRSSSAMSGGRGYTINNDLPWTAMAYTLRGQNYFVEDMNSPENGKGTLWSAYRDYGRFGADPKVELKDGQSSALKFRFWVGAGQPPTRADFQREYEAYAKDAKASESK